MVAERFESQDHRDARFSAGPHMLSGVLRVRMGIFGRDGWESVVCRGLMRSELVGSQAHVQSPGVGREPCDAPATDIPYAARE